MPSARPPSSFSSRSCGSEEAVGNTGRSSRHEDLRAPRLSGRAALRRSRELGKGYYLRNLGVLWVVMFVMLLAAMVLGAIVGLTGYLAGVDPKVLDFLSGLAGLLVAPPVPIFMVLLYYDMRVRKEGYGAAQLADDLRF